MRLPGRVVGTESAFPYEEVAQGFIGCIVALDIFAYRLKG